jgi:hypothetical protein
MVEMRHGSSFDLLSWIWRRCEGVGWMIRKQGLKEVRMSITTRVMLRRCVRIRQPHCTSRHVALVK